MARGKTTKSAVGGAEMKTKTKTKMGIGGRMIAWYATKLETHPFTTKCITSGMISGLGNITCQYLEQRKATSNENEENSNGGSSSSGNNFTIQWDRTARFGILGFALIAPVVHVWYGFLTRTIPGVSIPRVLQRTFLDQVVFSPIFIPVFMSSLMMLEGGPKYAMAIFTGQYEYEAEAEAEADRGDNDDALERGHEHPRREMWNILKKDLPDVVVANWSIWGPAMLVNFRYVPIKFQVLYSNSVGFIWNVYLSSKLHREGDDSSDDNNNADGDGDCDCDESGNESDHGKETRS